jgi:serine/threonine protein kinase
MSDKGKSVGVYTIEDRIGEGGMGEVWLSRHPTLERLTVLKKLRKDLAGMPEIAERFAREARAAAAVHHPNVVMVYDAFTHRNDLYIALEYVDGVDLRTALQRGGRLPVRIAAGIALELARGLEAIHARGMVHRDLKPANALLGRGGEAKIVDFGIALESSAPALTRVGVVLGTPEYMAPEQLQGDRVDARADVFALSCILYEMLTGWTPYPEGGEEDSDTRLTRMRKERYEPVRKRRRDVPRRLARLIRDGLRSKSSQRIASSTAFRDRLEHHLGHPTSESLRAELAAHLWGQNVFERRESETVLRVAAPVSNPRRKLRRRLVWIGAGLTAAGIAAAAAAATGWISIHPTWLAPRAAEAPAGDSAKPKRESSPPPPAAPTKPKESLPPPPAPPAKPKRDAVPPRRAAPNKSPRPSAGR